MPSISRALVWQGWDVHKDTIAVGVLEPGADSATVERIFHDEASVRRLVARFDLPRLRVCYEAGPTGYELQRLLGSLGVACEVVAPSLIPRAPADRVKTDKRDCRRLVRLYRAGELVAIRVPTATEEAVRDLCRARADVVADRRRARQRLGALLLRHGGCTARRATGRKPLPVAAKPAFRRAGVADHLRALPGDHGDPRRPARRRLRRSAGVV